jgi:hypothetical protein
MVVVMVFAMVMRIVGGVRFGVWIFDAVHGPDAVDRGEDQPVGDGAGGGEDADHGEGEIVVGVAVGTGAVGAGETLADGEAGCPRGFCADDCFARLREDPALGDRRVVDVEELGLRADDARAAEAVAKRERDRPGSARRSWRLAAGTFPVGTST